MGLLEPRHDANADADIDDDDDDDDDGGDGDAHDDDDGSVDDDHNVGSCDNVHDDDDGSVEDIPQLRCCIDGGFAPIYNVSREKTELTIVPHWSEGQFRTLKKFVFASKATLR